MRAVVAAALVLISAFEDTNKTAFSMVSDDGQYYVVVARMDGTSTLDDRLAECLAADEAAD